MAKYRRTPPRAHRDPLADTNIREQTTAAQESAKQSRRAVFVAWVGVALNTAVVATALIIPALQRSWAEHDKAVEMREQDRRALMAGYSRLVEASMVLSSGGLLDIDACPTLKPANKVDRARITGINRRMAALNGAIFTGGAPTLIQSDVQAGMIRIFDSIEDAFYFIQTGPESDLSRAQKVGYCQESIAEVIIQSATIRDRLRYDYKVYRKPIPSPYPFGRPTSPTPIVTEELLDLDASLDGITLPTKDGAEQNTSAK